jgi:hypothetical protein
MRVLLSTFDSRGGVEPLVPAGEPVRALVHRARPPSPDDVPRLTAELIATWFDAVSRERPPVPASSDRS